MKIKRLSETAKVPTRGSEHSAGLDLYSDMPTLRISSGEFVMMRTGIAVELPKNTFGGVYARSGLATKQGLRPANCTSVIDSDYRGELIVPLYNDSKFSQLVTRGDRIAQLVIQPYVTVDFEEVQELAETERGTGGFGSTGK